MADDRETPLEQVTPIISVDGEAGPVGRKLKAIPQDEEEEGAEKLFLIPVANLRMRADGKFDAERINVPTSDWGTGQTTVGATAVPLTATSTPIEWVDVTIESQSTGRIYIGKVGVTTTNGDELDAICPKRIRATNLNEVYVVASIASQTVCYRYHVQKSKPIQLEG